MIGVVIVMQKANRKTSFVIIFGEAIIRMSFS